VDALWTSVLAATVRTAATILRRTSAEQERIRIAFDRLSAEYTTAEGLVIPVSVKLIVGRAA
jgi:hypothetical protein